MKKSKHGSVFTVCYCTSIVLTFILLYSCAGTTHTQTTQSVPILTTETETVVWKRVKNPETGVTEMRLVSKEHTKTQTPTAPKAGHSAQKTDWGFYAVCYLIIGVSYLIIALD